MSIIYNYDNSTTVAVSLSHCLCVFCFPFNQLTVLGFRKKDKSIKKQKTLRSKIVLVLATTCWMTIGQQLKWKERKHTPLRYLFCRPGNKIQQCMLWCGKANCPYGIHSLIFRLIHSYTTAIFFCSSRIDWNKQGKRELGASKPHICTVCFMCSMWMTDCLFLMGMTTQLSFPYIECCKLFFSLQIGIHTDKQTYKKWPSSPSPPRTLPIYY